LFLISHNLYPKWLSDNYIVSYGIVFRKTYQRLEMKSDFMHIHLFLFMNQYFLKQCRQSQRERESEREREREKVWGIREN